MLKIKDDVDLEKLESFGYEDFGVCYKKYEQMGLVFFVDKGTRKITRLHPYSLREEPNEYELYDLSQSGLLERIDDK